MADDIARRALIDGGDEDAVTVNQRALIDKILARYAAEFTVWRELLQNASDSGATHCQLRFETVDYRGDHSSVESQTAPSQLPSASSEPDLKAPLKSWVFKNNGRPFTEDDWGRLRRIAEGNPDPDKIGAFGVGFYSLFSICEEPVVASGEGLMGFFWKNGGDSLFTRRAKNPHAAKDVSPTGVPWTSFYMALREKSPFPESPLQLSRFLATSLTFATNVRTLELWFDGHLLCKLDKSLEPCQPLAMPSHMNPASPERMMRVSRIESQSMSIEAEVMAVVWENERERLKAEQSRARRPNLATALTKAGGLTSMLQNAFGSRAKEKGSSTPSPASGVHNPIEGETAESRVTRLLAKHSAKAQLRIATSHINVSTDAQYRREIERSTKKAPPAKTAFSIVWVNKEEYQASYSMAGGSDTQMDSDKGRLDTDIGPRIVFDGLMPKLDRMGHVFIGFRTHQTTGFAGHVAARFIPTVERESIDFIDRHCARWNMELLSMGGYTCRAVFEAELEKLRASWPRTEDETGKKQRQELLDQALHTMQFFTSRDSSPSTRVSNTLATAFFSSSRQNVLTLASTRGVQTSAHIRLPNAVLLEFVKNLAVIPPNHIEQAGEFFDQVRSRGLLKEITLEDVFGELSARSLDVDEAVHCLRWWVNVSAHPGYDTRLRGRLLDSLVVTVESQGDGKASSTSVQSLSSITSFLNTQRIASTMPLPPACLNPEVSKAFSPSELEQVFGWSELTVASWVSHLVSLSSQPDCPIDVNLQLSPPFAEKVFGVISRSWGNISGQQQQEVASLLSSQACVPTKKGMQRPDASYFANVSLFEDLPIVEFPSATVKGNLEKVLVALNVRRHVDLQLIFTRLVGGGDWSHVELLSYLSANRETLSSMEIDRLRKTPIWPREGEKGSLSKDGKEKPIRYRANQLYEPVEPLRQLNLPLLNWSSHGTSKPWRPGSDEAKFAYHLGLKKHPSLDEILALASAEDASIRSKALLYFLEKDVYRNKEYDFKIANQYAFVPCHLNSENGAKEVSLRKRAEVFTNPEAAVMGLPTVAQLDAIDVAKLQLRVNPNGTMLVSSIVNRPPKTLARAKAMFEYLASVQTAFSGSDLAILRQAAFVPVSPSQEGSVKADTNTEVQLASPELCYFGGNDTVKAFRSVFLYVPDLGQKANSFLRLVGVCDEPSVEEVATRLVADPPRFYSLSGSIEAYLGLLRHIANNWSRIKPPLRSAMKQTAFLLASKRMKEGTASAAPSSKTKSLLDDDEEEDEEGEDAGMLVHSLKRPSDVVIADDANAGMIFGSSLFFAPHEDLLEQNLYRSLGSPLLSTLVEERYEMAGSSMPDSPKAREVRSLVLERTPLFLFETRQSGSRADIKHDAEWLKAALEVTEIGGDGLRLSRVLRFQGEQVRDVQRASATAQKEGSKVRLFVASNTRIDWFEVAAALNKFLLSRQRLQEVLLFMTLLSTSLRDLKRRGFHVDKILQQRKAERDAFEQQKVEEERKRQLEALTKPSETQLRRWQEKVSELFPDADTDHVNALLRQQKANHLEQTTQAMAARGYPRKPTREIAPVGQETDIAKPDYRAASAIEEGSLGGGNGFFSSFRNRFRRPAEGPSSLADGTSSIEGRGGALGSMPGGFQSRQSSHNENAVQLHSSGGTQKIGDKPAEQPSPLDNIRRNVLSAISASRPDQSTSVHSKEHQTQVKEAESTYCDSTGVAANLNLGGEVAGMRVFLSPELDPATTLPTNKAALERLINQVYRPVGAIFGLDPRSMHVFVDVSGPTIAFNRGGTIWLNLRYYLAWHDEAVQRGDLTDALISTYFSVAHEIAHNIEQQHNAQHEFYTSALCEHFFMALAKYIATVAGDAA
ncbi:unnamed protein product [Parajaminaea phylloscopi]